MITIGTTLFKSNGTPPWSRCYSPAWVDRLYRGVARNYKYAFKFVCLTDDPSYQFVEDIEIQPLKHTRWQTTCLQLHGIKADRLCLMGLDTIVVGNLEEIFSYKGMLAVPRDPYRTSMPCNGVVLCPTRYDIADSGAPSDMAALEAFQYEWLDDLFPNQILSYKVHLRDKGLEEPPEGTKIVYFHGEPKPNLLTDHKWIQDNWK